jgi:PAS domain S-box-containing protein
MAEERLREREQRLRLAVEAATAGACDLDIAQQCIHFSGKAAQIFGLGEATEVMLDDFLTKLHPEDAAKVSAMFAAAACGHGHYQEEFRVVINHGATRWIHLRMAPHLQGEGPPRIVGIAIDITLAKTAQIQIQDLLAQTQELLAQKETLVREIDHRVKNSLQLAASTLSAQARSERDPRVRRGLRHAEQRLFAMAQVHKIIQEAEHVGEVRLGDQIEQLAMEFNQLSDSVVQIETYGDDVCLPARKAVSLSVIVNELLMNVLKHTAEQEKVHVQIEWRLRESELFLTLRDDGPGMTEGVANGFGSRMISALVVQLAGSLTVHSDPKGTRYEIIVPLDHLTAVQREVTGGRKPRSR